LQHGCGQVAAWASTGGSQSATPLLSDGTHSTMLIRFSCLLAILPVSMAAEFDKCARANALWAGFDQACSRSLCSFQACD